MLTTLFAGLGLLAFLLGVVAAAAVLFWQMLWGTSKAELPLIAEQTRLDLREAQNASVRVHLEIEALLSSLKADEEWLHSIHWNREKLLRRNWRAMRDSEWEHFLADVLRALGWDTTVLGQSGDQGVDLVVTRDDRRYAIQAKGYHHSVGNKAVQEAVAGMAHHGCNACAVITNSIYTRGAVELAASNCCVLIGEADIPALGRGKLAPFDA